MNRGWSLKDNNHGEFWIRSYLRTANDDWLRACLKTAYLDMAQRTLDSFTKLPNAKTIKEEAMGLLRQRLLGLRAVVPSGDMDRFDTWHRTTCTTLVDFYNQSGYHDEDGKPKFYIGQAQKWVNMSLKYAVHLGDHLPDYGEIYDLCHAPIDNRVLAAFRKLNRPDFPSPSYAWSRLRSYDADYLPFQNWIRQTFHAPPLEVEFWAWIDGDVSFLLVPSGEHSGEPSGRFPGRA
jgi:hypothetical protein